MAVDILFKRGTKAAIDLLAAQGGLLQGEPLYFTDLETVGIATGISTYNILDQTSWAAKYGPTSYGTAFKANFSGGRGYNDKYFDWTTYGNGILIKVTGQYEVRAVQRSNGTGLAYINLSLNGDRDTLIARTSGIYFGDSSPDNTQYTTSSYIGQLNANEIISCGAPNTTVSGYLVYSSNDYDGTLLIKRLT